MRGRRSDRTLFGALVAVVVVGTAAAAWACTAVTSLSASPGEGPAGSRVILTGGRFGPGPVKVRWDTTSGTILTTTEGPDFTVAVTIPSTANVDTHLIYASGSGGDARVVFKVVPGSAEHDTGAERSTSQGTTAGSSISGISDPGTKNAPASAQEGSPQVAAAGSGAAFPTPGAASAAEPQPSRSTASNASGSSEDHAVAPATPSAEAGTRAQTSRVNTGPAVVAPGVERTTPRVEPEATAAVAASPSAASAVGDAWSGFEPGRPLERGASLTEPIPDSTGMPTQAGALLLVGGLVALFAGFGMAELRRTRVKAH